MPENQQKPKKKKDKDNYTGLEQYAKYTGIAFEMVAIILVAVWGGMKLDEKFNDDEPLFIIIFAILGVFIALYVVLKDFIQFKK